MRQQLCVGCRYVFFLHSSLVTMSQTVCRQEASSSSAADCCHHPTTASPYRSHLAVGVSKVQQLGLRESQYACNASSALQYFFVVACELCAFGGCLSEACLHVACLQAMEAMELAQACQQPTHDAMAALVHACTVPPPASQWAAQQPVCLVRLTEWHYTHRTWLVSAWQGRKPCLVESPCLAPGCRLHLECGPGGSCRVHASKRHLKQRAP